MRARIDYDSIRAEGQMKRVRKNATGIPPDRNKTKLERGIDEARVHHILVDRLPTGEFDRCTRESVRAFHLPQATERCAELSAELAELRVNGIDRHRRRRGGLW